MSWGVLLRGFPRVTLASAAGQARTSDSAKRLFGPVRWDGKKRPSISRSASEAKMSWTDERVELLRQLWLDGKSASQISAALGQGLTRNAVIGKVHRLGLAGRAKTSSPASPG